MYKDTVVYEDFNGDVVEEDLYFNLTKAEALDLETSVPGGYSAQLRKIRDSADVSEVLGVIKMIIQKSYGKKSEDGRRFIKSAQATEEFMQSEAYSEFYFSLLEDEGKKLSAFVSGVLPKVEGVDVDKLISGEVDPDEEIKRIEELQRSRQSLRR